MDSQIIACPSCHTRVRVPLTKLQDHPVCAKCKSPVLAGNPIELDAPSFQTHAERSTFPVLVDFWAPWCGPCKMMAPVLDRVAERSRTRIQVGKVNTDEEQVLAQRFGIRSIPTLILFREGRELARQSGAVDAATLGRWLEHALQQN
jgi:thioredoxin 2